MCYCSNKLTNKNIVDNRFSMFCKRNKKISLFVAEKFAKNLSLIEIFPEVYFIENVTIVLVRTI